MERSETGARATDWLLSGLLLVAVAVALGGLNSVLTDVAWWFVACAVATIVLLAAAVVRTVARHRLWGTLAAFVAAVCSITLFFAPASAFLWIIPTFDTFDALHKVDQAGLESVANQGIPANADQGIVYLVCLGVAAIAFVIDTLAFAFRAPAFTGIPLLAILLVPTFVVASLSDAFFFLLTAISWLAILLLGSRRGGRRIAVGIGAAALVASLIVPVLLPVPDPGADATGGAGFAAGINPIITLGNDLRQGDPRLAVTYTTSAVGGEYLRLAALDNFTGESWVPTSGDLDPANNIGSIGPVPGLGDAVPVEHVATRVTVANILSRWLPVPYAPSSVTGLVGQWFWDPGALSIRSDNSNARNQVYEVASVQVAPSVDQLVAAGTTLEPGLDRYLQLPPDLPPVVASTATQVVAGATTNYAKAIALQDFFTGGTFRYSEDAPVKKGYDGSGALVLAAFLAGRSGYCVHFSSAMAAMARTLGIPARVAVGFTPGAPVSTTDGPATEYRVTTHDLHAWPELYFAGIGWVRFEPTPGRGVTPAFAPLAVDDPSTPGVDESKPTPSTAAPTADPSAAPPLQDSELPSATATPVAIGDAATPPSPPPLALLIPLAALLAVPGVVRTFRRQRRFGMLRGGSALAGWLELRDTADDLGLRTSDARTPRQLAGDLAGHLDDGAAAALARLRVALESEAFGDGAKPPAAADLSAVLQSLRRDAGLARRIAAAALPCSLFERWMPQPQAPEPDPR